MKKIILVAALISVIGATELVSQNAEAQTCAITFTKEGQWRKSITNSMSGKLAETSPTRESEIKKNIQEMTDSVLKNEETPGMIFQEAEPVSSVWIKESPGYGSGVIDRLGVSSLGSSGVLRGSLLLPVSGHIGPENAKKWSKTDTYNIILTLPDGSTKTIVSGAKSRDIVTVQELEIKLEKDKVYKISYDRSGSAGPGGAMELRVLEIVWDGK